MMTSEETNRRLWLWVTYNGQCARCGQYTLTVAGLEPVTFGQITVAICSRCSRAGGASRLRAVYRDAKKGKHMIDRDSYPGQSRPGLKPDSIGYPKVNAAVLTIADVDPAVEIPEENGNTRKVLTVIFKEFPDLTFYTNKTSREALIEQLGLNEKNWIGERVPLIVVQTNNPQTKKAQPSLWVADPAEWDTHLKSKRGKK